MSFRFTRLVLFFALSNFIICNCWAKPECTRVSLTPSSMADSFSKDVSADFLHSSHRRFSRQDCRKASQTIHTSAIRQSLYTSLVALVWGQRVKQFWLTKKTADRLFIPFNNKGKKHRVVLIGESLINSLTTTTIALNLWNVLTSRVQPTISYVSLFILQWTSNKT